MFRYETPAGHFARNGQYSDEGRSWALAPKEVTAPPCLYARTAEEARVSHCG
jgi:hypothetical protein